MLCAAAKREVQKQQETRWTQENSYCLGTFFLAAFEKEAQLLDTRQHSSVSEAVRALNNQQVNSPSFCLVFSLRKGAYFLLWPSEKSDKEVADFTSRWNNALATRKVPDHKAPIFANRNAAPPAAEQSKLRFLQTASVDKGCSGMRQQSPAVCQNDGARIIRRCSTSPPPSGRYRRTFAEDPMIETPREATLQQETCDSPLDPVVHHVTCWKDAPPAPDAPQFSSAASVSKQALRATFKNNAVCSTPRSSITPRTLAEDPMPSRGAIEKMLSRVTNSTQAPCEATPQQEPCNSLFGSLVTHSTGHKVAPPTAEQSKPRFSLGANPEQNTAASVEKESSAVPFARHESPTSFEKIGVRITPCSSLSPPPLDGYRRTLAEDPVCAHVATSTQPPRILAQECQGQDKLEASTSSEPETDEPDTTPSPSLDGSTSSSQPPRILAQECQGQDKLEALTSTERETDEPNTTPSVSLDGSTSSIISAKDVVADQPKTKDVSLASSTTMKIEDLYINQGEFDPNQPQLKSQLLKKLNIAESAAIEKLCDNSGSFNDGIWIIDSALEGLVLKLVPHHVVGRKTDTEKYIELQQLCPQIASELSLSFPLKIFQLRGPSGDRCKDLLVMRKAPGLQITQHLFFKFHEGRSAELSKIFEDLGKFVRLIHLVYTDGRRSMQHGDCQPSNVFYDEVSGAFTLVDVADFGFGPYLALGGEDDVEHFVDGLCSLKPWYGQSLIDTCAYEFRKGYGEREIR